MRGDFFKAANYQVGRIRPLSLTVILPPRPTPAAPMKAAMDTKSSS